MLLVKIVIKIRIVGQPGRSSWAHEPMSLQTKSKNVFLMTLETNVLLIHKYLMNPMNPLTYIFKIVNEIQEKFSQIAIWLQKWLIKTNFVCHAISKKVIKIRIVGQPGRCSWAHESMSPWAYRLNLKTCFWWFGNKFIIHT